ncbi:MAG: NADH oxidase, partial [Chloroflexi bacterium]|nr:NADH oxidase [Chloroflexota bacterium]
MNGAALFTPGRIGTLEIKNRILMAPLLTNQADADGFVTDVLIEYYRKRAMGGTGMIIVEQSAVTQRWPCSSRVIAV